MNYKHYLKIQWSINNFATSIYGFGTPPPTFDALLTYVVLLLSILNTIHLYLFPEPPVVPSKA